MQSKITIIIPLYNVEQYLHRCLDSVLNQTFKDWTAILVDDGSPDNSGKIADDYARRDSRFIVIHKPNGGLSSARNSGLKIAKGKYIMFLDSDDCIHPQTMEILWTLAEKESADVVSFEYDRDAHNAIDAVNFPPDKMPDNFKTQKYDIDKIKYKRFKNLLNRATNRDYGIKAWWVQACMVTMRFYRREFIKDLMFDENVRILEDVMFWSRVLLRCPNGIITRLPLYYYTVNPGSILHSGHGLNGVLGIIHGMHIVAQEFMKRAPRCVARLWASRFMWDILSRIYNSVMRMKNPDDIKSIVHELEKLKNDGTLDFAPDFHAWRYSRRLKRFIIEHQNI